MIRILIPSLLFFVLMGCGLSTGPDTQVDDSSQQVGSPTPLADAPTPLAASTEEGGKVVFESRPDVPFHGDMSIEEKIFENAVIVRAMMTSEFLAGSCCRTRRQVQRGVEIQSQRQGVPEGHGRFQRRGYVGRWQALRHPGGGRGQEAGGPCPAGQPVGRPGSHHLPI